MDYLEKMKKKVQGIQEELEELQDNVVSNIKNNETVKEIKKKAQQAKKELEKDFDKLKKETNEEVAELRNSLNDIIYWKNKTPDTEKEKKAKGKEVSESLIVTDAAIKYMKSKLKFEVLGKDIKLLNEKTERKVRNILNDYLKKYPLLKKKENGKMQFEIWDKKEFAEMVSSLRTTMINSIPRWLKQAFSRTDIYKKANNILSNVNKSLPNLDANEYESIIFWWIWWVIKEVVKAVWWKMTLEDYYNDISTYYPNKNATQVSKDLAESGWAKYNIDATKWYT